MKNKLLLDAIGGIDDKYIAAAEPVHTAGQKAERITAKPIKKSAKIWRFVPVAASFALVVALGTIFTGNKPQIDISGKTPAEIIFTDTDVTASAVYTGVTTINAEKDVIPHCIFINELSEQPFEAGDIGLNWDDAIIIGANEMQGYYGVDVFPANLPNGFVKEIAVDDLGNGTFYYFQNGENGVYYDQNTIIYESEAAAAARMESGYRDNTLPTVMITVSKAREVFWDTVIAEVSSAPVETSTINGCEFTVCHYIDYCGDHYIAYFVKNGVSFEISGNMISEEEFITLISDYS